MIILHIVTNLTTGGAELMLKRLAARHVDDSRFTHLVISLREKGTVGPQLESLGVPVEALGLRGIVGVPKVLWQLRRRIRQLRPDIVQTWMYHADLLGGIAARLAGVRSVIWGVRTTDIALAGVPRSTLFIRRLCARLSGSVPSRILYVAEAARLLHERLGYQPAKSVVIQNGYEVPPLDTIAPARERRRAELGLGRETVLIGSAGRFSPEKGYDTFVATSAVIGRSHPNTRFVLIGRDVTWHNKVLSRWIHVAGMADRYSLLGESRDIHEWLAAMDVFVMCSLFEGFPNIVAEAMSVRTPCLVTDVGDAALLVGGTARVVAPRNVDQVIAELDRMLAVGEAGRRAQGDAARERIASNFAIQAIARRYEALYEDVACER